MQHPFTKPSQRSASNEPSEAPATSGPQQGTLSITLSPLRQTPTSPAPVTIAAHSKTSIYDLKAQLATKTGYAADKLKILWERKPVTDSKTVTEATGAQSGSLEMGVMYVGAPTSASSSNEGSAADRQPSTSDAKPVASANTGVDETPVAQGLSGKAVLDSEDFWEDLRGFVVQRVRDQGVADEAVERWRKK